MVRRYRVELFEGGRGHRSAPSPMSSHVDEILRELHELRARAASAGSSPSPDARPGQSVDGAIAVWSGVEDIQRRLEVTKSEIAALRERGVVGEGTASRTTDELRAVITGTEEATDTILAAAETVDAVAQRLAESTEEPARSDGKIITDAVIRIYEACNFQDICGQRITKVVESLQFIEERIASMIDVWQTINQPAQAADRPSETEAEGSARRLLNGPSLKNDPGVVSQDDVDAMFS